ncbi:FixH family protein [Alkalihalobacillus pseudalcaliphilus]|uniref:FixH family protein n=1 Tax=Alkalihalobacillus pseudalcaliphilus TaxID=79884 RepID=UPI00064E0AAE|nr:FixH family protein [Alkalihalobacillus pseudalcaliphilus]KMK78156.1 hypothetical protein AB990_01585 [Alkalihalobacillus pseudalcaliphilus]
MNSRMKWLFAGLFLFILTACGNEEGNEQPDALAPVEVEMILDEQIDLNDSVSIGAVVTHGEQHVEDADEVIFEIWSIGDKDNSEMIEAEHTENGLYEIEYTFESEGIFYVQSHVTARGLHVMPTEEVIIGTLSDEEIEAIKEEHENHDEHSEHEDHHDHHEDEEEDHSGH